MREFFKENKIFLAIIIGALIIGVGVYFGLNKSEGRGTTPGPTKCLAPPKTMVTKVIDGDTIIVEGGYHVRLLGLDADERGYPCYEEAKSRLEELILNKEVKLEKDQTDIDQYGRCLRYIFLDGQNINLRLVKDGLAVARFYPPDIKHQEEITQAEEEAINNKVGCKWGGIKPIVEQETKSRSGWERLTTAKLGFDVVGACNAGKYLGKELIVEGKVADAYHDLKSNTVFLNFEKPYPNQCFAAVIFSSDLHKFVQSPEDYYLNKTIRIMGEVKEYKGRPEIILETPNQIEIGK